MEDTLAGLGLLDEVDPGPSATAFRSALASELEAPAPQTSRFGRGLLVGRIGDLIGLDMETVFVIGMTDAAFPGRVADDPLVPDAQRSAHPALPPRGARASEARRDYLAALASADVRVLSYARGDQRGGRVQRPSRWLLDTLGALVAGGRRLYLGDLAGLDPHPAFVRCRPTRRRWRGRASPCRSTTAISAPWCAGRRATERLNRHFLVDVDPVLRLGDWSPARAARGRLHPVRRADRGPGRSLPGRRPGAVAHRARALRRLSAALLSSTASCASPCGSVPRRSCPSRPSTGAPWSIESSRRSSGSRPPIPPTVASGRPAPGDPTTRPAACRWPTACSPSSPRRGLTGRALFWEVQRSAIVRDLKRFLVEDSRFRAEKQAVPEAVEFAVRLRRRPSGGGAARRPADRPLPGRRRPGRPPPRSPGAGRRPVYVVIDYKTGSAYGVDGLQDDPVARGTRLQLPIYGLAAAPAPGCGGRCEARTGSSASRGGFAQPRLRARAARPGAVRRRYCGSWSTASRPAPSPPGPAQGPGQDNVRTAAICPFDAVCPTDRQAAWERKRRADPVLAAYAGDWRRPHGNAPTDRRGRTPDGRRTRWTIDALRRGRGGHRQDHAAGRAHPRSGRARPGPHRPDRRHHLHRGGGGRAARPDRRASWSGWRLVDRRRPSRRRPPAASAAGRGPGGAGRRRITTLHGFARRILAEHPFEAGLPPVFEVLDEIRSGSTFEERWAEFLDRAARSGPAEPAHGPGPGAAGSRVDHLREVAKRLNENWDLVADARGSAARLRCPIDAGCSSPGEPWRWPATAATPRTGLLSHLGTGRGRWRRGWPHAMASWTCCETLGRARPGSSVGNSGKGPALGRAEGRGPRRCSDRRPGPASGVVRATLSGRSRTCWRRIAGLTARAAERTPGEGRLEFHDLLVLARDLRRAPRRAARRRCTDSYRYLLIDEFQDTDPIQAELAVRIASGDPDRRGRPWPDLTVEPGRLFFVGDPKQSIYRFRRADIALFMQARDRRVDRAAPADHQLPVGRPAIVDWVNAVFGELIGDGRAAGSSRPTSR